jgi:hypothetical protein
VDHAEAVRRITGPRDGWQEPDKQTGQTSADLFTGDH